MKARGRFLFAVCGVVLLACTAKGPKDSADGSGQDATESIAEVRQPDLSGGPEVILGPDWGDRTDRGCQPDCVGKQCGNDGCGGSCGECPPIAPVCKDSICSVCVPDCESKWNLGELRECGSDGCGATCGVCPPEAPTCTQGKCSVCPPECDDDLGREECDVGLCSACVPDCQNKACGDDGCGGACGTCPADSMCYPDQTCGPVDCEVLLKNTTVVRLRPMHLSLAASPGQALDLDFDGQLDNGLPALLTILLPTLELVLDMPLELSDLADIDLSEVFAKPRPLLTFEGFNTTGAPFDVTFHYGLPAGDQATCDDTSEVCSYLLDPDLFQPTGCGGKVVLKGATAQGGKLYAGGPDVYTSSVYVPGRLYIPASANAYMVQLQADVEETDSGLVLSNGVLGFAFSFYHFSHYGGCYALMPHGPGCEVLPSLLDPYRKSYDTEFGVSVAFLFSGHPAVAAGICEPDCADKPCDAPNGCGGLCQCAKPKVCVLHMQCEPGQLCLLQDGQSGQPTDVCGLCGEGEACVCATPTWAPILGCESDEDCLAIGCGDQCDDCPPCPACINGWCAHDTWKDVECICSPCG